VIAIFDFISHAAMHLPFNEGYIRTVRAGFPNERVRVFAKPGHVAALAPRFADDPMVEFRAGAPYAVPLGMSRHNPVGGTIAARGCLAAMREMVAGEPLTLAAVLGADSHLHSILRRRWPLVAPSPLHIVLHNHIAEAMMWRSRNPLVRRFDLLSRFRHPMPESVRLIALAPALRGALATLEHPILESDWVPPRDIAGRGGPLRIGFLGFAALDKGFGDFAAWARRSAGPERSFHAVGLAAPDAWTLDLSGLSTLPARTSVPRDAYTAGVADCDVVCLRLSPLYDYVASGSVMDAIAALKPLYSVRNHSLTRLEERYGAFGVLTGSVEELGEVICSLDRPTVADRAAEWMESLARIRMARRPEALGPGYAAQIGHDGADTRLQHGRQSKDAGAKQQNHPVPGLVPLDSGGTPS
jgi:hypothetical protein